MTTRQVAAILKAPGSNAALFLDRGQVYLDDGVTCQQLEGGPAILCSLAKRHKIAPIDVGAHIWVWEQ